MQTKSFGKFFSAMTIELKTDQDLSLLTFWGIGGPAKELYTISDVREIPELWAETIAQKIPFLVLGKGSNTCLSERGFNGRIFRITDKTTTWKEGNVVVHAGAEMQKVIEESNEKGYADWCNLSGIPGVLGAFVRGNAGAFGAETQDKLTWVEYADADGTVKTITKAAGKFGYRHSIFKENPGWIVLRAGFQLTEKEVPEVALERTKKLFKERWAKYPKGRSGGSFFKNPEGDFAGRLMEAAGAKGDQMGGIMISTDHANFVMNTGGGTQSDLLELMRKWQKKVLEMSGIELQPEVHLVSENGKTIPL